MVTALLILLVCASGGRSPAKKCKCDIIEFNTVYQDEKPFLQQVIFWEWDAEYGRYNVRSWVMDEMIEQLDCKRVMVRGWIVEGTIRFTKTAFDPERKNGYLHPHEKRNTMPWENRSFSLPCP